MIGAIDDHLHLPIFTQRKKLLERYLSESGFTLPEDETESKTDIDKYKVPKGNLCSHLYLCSMNISIQSSDPFLTLFESAITQKTCNLRSLILSDYPSPLPNDYDKNIS